jgi:hypothetical protein
MNDLMPIICNQPHPSFWSLQFKDLITGSIALAALVTSSTGVWVAYLRPRKLRCDLADTIRISYHSHSKRQVRIMADAYAMNTGARPGVITRMRIELHKPGPGNSKVALYWRETTKSEDIAEKGSSRRLWTSFAGFASAVLVPKYDSRLIEAAFFSEEDSEFEEDQTYFFELNSWIDGATKPIIGRTKQFTVSAFMLSFLQTRATANDQGIVDRHLYLTSEDGCNFIAPARGTWMPERQVTEEGLPKT